MSPGDISQNDYRKGGGLDFHPVRDTPQALAPSTLLSLVEPWGPPLGNANNNGKATT